MSPSSDARPSVWRFTLRQFLSLMQALVAVMGGGIVVAMWHRRWHMRAAIMASLIMLLPQAALWLHTILRASQPVWPQSGLWACSLTAAVCAGAAAARISRRMALWELYGATWLTFGVTYARFSARVPLMPWALEQAAPLGPDQALGTALLGPLWGPTLTLWAPLMLVTATLGASLAVLFFGMGRGTRSRKRELGIALEWRLAVRHLAGSRRQAVSTTAQVTVLGVALGVASLIVVTAVMSGYQSDIEKKILNTNAHLVLQKYGIDFAEHPNVVATAQATEGIEAAAPFAFNEAMLSVGGRGVGVLLKGIDARMSAQVTGHSRALCLQTEHALDFPEPHCTLAAAAGAKMLAEKLTPSGTKPPNVIVGLALYRRLGVPLGSQVHLMTPVGMAGSRGGAPKRMAFTLGGVFSSGMHEFDAHLVYVDLGAAQKLLGLGQSVSGIEMRLSAPDDVVATADRLLAALGHYPYRTLDWRELNASIFMALSLQKVVMFLVLTFIVVVAAFNIASTLFMAVVEKGPQMAVLLSLGATRATVMKIFVIEGWLTGLVGTLSGALLGCLVTRLLESLEVHIASDVYMVDALTVTLAPHEVAVTITAALVICHLATLYPALRATRARPIDLLRHG